MALELAKTKRILEMLVDKGALAPDKQQWIVDGIKNGAVNGKHSGEFAVGAGLVTADILHETLKEQATVKALAAAKDIKIIAEKGTQEAPDWLTVNVGHGEVVTPAAENATPIEGAAAAANIAQNIVMLANKTPNAAKDLTKAVEAASALAVYFTSDAEQQRDVPAETLKQWQRDASEGLRNAVQQAKLDVPKPELVESYLAEREKEISGALGVNQWQDVIRKRSQQGGGLPPL